MTKVELHGREHLPNGEDPIPFFLPTRIVRGSLEADGTIRTGLGFTSDQTPGDSSGTAATGAQCEITFDDAFAEEPIVVVGAGWTDPYRANVQLLGNVSTVGFTVTTYDIDNSAAAGSFAWTFVAIEQ